MPLVVLLTGGMLVLLDYSLMSTQVWTRLLDGGRCRHYIDSCVWYLGLLCVLACARLQSLRYHYAYFVTWVPGNDRRNNVRCASVSPFWLFLFVEKFVFDSED